MEIKPMYDNTIKMSVSNIKLDNVSEKLMSKNSLIPNGIYRVIKWEKIRQLITMTISSILLLTAVILIILYATTISVSWIAYSIPIILLLLSSWKLFTTIFERKSIIRDVSRYKEDLKIGLNSTPPFISKLYMSLHIKQVSHNWLSIFTIFYGSIVTILLWWLKDLSWWIFDFESWISAMFSNPTVMSWLFTSFLIAVSITHIFFAIQRNKRIQDINSYFGQTIAPQADIEAMKQSRNKMYRRLFVISILIILVIPMLVKFILRIFRKK